MVKRAVGTKACLLGKAVTCNYLRQDNFLEVNPLWEKKSAPSLNNPRDSSPLFLCIWSKSLKIPFLAEARTVLGSKFWWFKWTILEFTYITNIDICFVFLLLALNKIYFADRCWHWFIVCCPEHYWSSIGICHKHSCWSCYSYWGILYKPDLKQLRAFIIFHINL